MRDAGLPAILFALALLDARQSFGERLEAGQRVPALRDDPAPTAQNFHIAVFELSYQERDGWSGWEHSGYRAAGGEEQREIEKDDRNERFD
jgi:hypothetical protein